MSEVVERKSPVEIVGSFLMSAPVDLRGMTDALGLVVEEVGGWDNQISGSIERVGSTYVIKLNRFNSLGRKRFTLAHEIAHYILHRDLIGNGITDDILYRSNQPGYIETEANQYAAGILMPGHLMRQQWRQGIVSHAAMAAKFGVSTRAAEIRMKELSLR